MSATRETGALLPSEDPPPRRPDIEVRGLVKRYGDLAAVDGLSFAVDRGEVFGMLGPNGAGKTTTLEIVEGLRTPDAGSVSVLGTDVLSHPALVKERIGVQLQATSLPDLMKVREAVEMFTALYRHALPASDVIRDFNLEEKAETYTTRLSGGQMQRLSIALALVNDPDLVFLDEPTTGLDPEARRRTWAAVENLTFAGTTAVLTTHYIDEADHLADRVMVLSGGRIVADTTPQELRTRGGPSTIRWQLSHDVVAAGLPATLSPHLDSDGRTLVIRSADVTAGIRNLVSWADQRHLDLAGLEVGPPSLEDAYLTAIGQPLTPAGRSHD